MITDEKILKMIKDIRRSDLLYRAIVEKKLDDPNFDHDKFDIGNFRNWLKEVGVETEQSIKQGEPTCDHCGEKGGLMEDNRDRSFTCISCVNKINDSNIIDQDFG